MPSDKAVFLSYASEDADEVQRIAQALREGAITVWFDKSELRGGDAWDTSIRQQIRGCALFVPVISARTEERLEGYFRREWNLAAERTLDMLEGTPFLVPVVLDDTRQKDAKVPAKFRAVQWTKLPAGQTPPEFVAQVQRLLGADPAPAAPAVSAAGAPAAARAPAPGRRFAYALSALVALALAGGAWLLVHERGAPTASPADVAEQSIAVLPFTDMSEKHDQEYFSDGLAEELIDALAKIPGLRVPARTSSFHFKGRSEDITQIARELRVANVLEGSVRRSGNTVRVTVQLIRADQGFHVWSETFERSFQDIFQVQDDIVRSVVGALKVSVLGGASSRRPPSNIEAYNLYLRARYQYARFTEKDVESSVALLQQALALDPDYSPAWDQLAYAYFWMAGYTDADAEIFSRKAVEAARRALALAPEDADAHQVLARNALTHDYDGRVAEAEVAAAERIAPDDPQTLYSRALLAMFRGDVALGANKVLAALDRDPYQLEMYRTLGSAYACEGRYEDAEKSFLHVLHESPDAASLPYALALVYVLAGRTADAVRVAAAAPENWSGRTARALAYYQAGRHREADEQLRLLIELDAKNAAAQVAQVYALHGDREQTLQWIERAYRQKDAGIYMLKIFPLLRFVHGDPRFEALLHKIGASD